MTHSKSSKLRIKKKTVYLKQQTKWFVVFFLHATTPSLTSFYLIKESIMRLCYLLLFICLANFDVFAQPATTTYFDTLQWRCIGPFRGGRSCTVTGVAGKPDLFYFGSTGGGVWRTKNGGKSWENISDGYFGGSIGSVAVSESDNNVIYVGGGEKTVRGNVSFGYGVWKSVNAGKSWEQVGLNKSRHIGRIRIHPENPDVVLAAVMGDLFKPSSQRGVFKSIDGGKNWSKVLYVNDSVGAVDLIIDPNNPRIVYASTWRVSRSPYDMSSGGTGSGLWKSTDGGETWKNISSNKGLPKGTIGIIGVTISPLNSDRIWAIIESQKGGVFRSDDGGDTWKKTNESRALRQRAWYYTRIYADTKDENTVYVMNVNYHKSTDGGKTFKAARAPHGDHHDLWIAPEDPQRMIIGDDGGAQVTYNGGATWSTYQNQPTAQFYRISTDNHTPYRIYAAQQDNSTVRIPHRTRSWSITKDDWESTAGCECGHIAVDPIDQDIVFGGCYDGYLQMKNHRTKQSRAINVWPDNPMGHGAESMKYRFQWNFPLFFSPHDPNKLYTASNHLHVSTDKGQSWKTISPDLTRNDSTKLGPSGGPITKDNTSVEYYCTIFAAVESPRKKDLLWTGSDDGLIHVSQDGGKSWTNVTPKQLPEWSLINSIEADPFNDGGLYIAATRYKMGDYQPLLFHTTDFGKTWKKITSGIAEEHFTRVIRADQNVKGLLFAGTESGLYISYDNGQKWNSFQKNLPIVPITDMTIKDNDLIVATQGRSIWILDNIHIIRQAINKKDNSISLFQPDVVFRMPGGQNSNSKTQGVNHAAGLQLHYYIPQLSDSTLYSLTILDEKGDTCRHFSKKAKEKNNQIKLNKGSGILSWDLQYESARTFPGMINFWASMSGPKALPGNYTAILEINRNECTTPFTIKNDPLSEATPEDLKKQFDFVTTLRDKLTDIHVTIIQIRQIKSNMDKINKQLKENEDDNKEMIELAKTIQTALTNVEKALYQTQNQSAQDPLNFPIRLNNKIGHLNSLQYGDYPPTKQAIEVRNELFRQTDEELAKFNTIIQKDIEQFNNMFSEKKMKAIWIEKQ